TNPVRSNSPAPAPLRIRGLTANRWRWRRVPSPSGVATASIESGLYAEPPPRAVEPGATVPREPYNSLWLPSLPARPLFFQVPGEGAFHISGGSHEAPSARVVAPSNSAPPPPVRGVTGSSPCPGASGGRAGHW